MADAYCTPRERKLAVLLATIIVAVTLLNGAGIFLTRTGLVNRPVYDHYLESNRKGTPFANWYATTPPFLQEQVYKLRPERSAVVLKLLKDGVVLTLVTLSVVCLVRRFTSLPSFRSAWPGYLLAGLSTASFLLTACQQGLLLPLAGTRSYSFLLLALVAGWLARRTFVTAFAAAAGALLVLETSAVCFEALRGLPMYGQSVVAAGIPSRLVGTLNLPNSLGAFAVLAFAFYLSYAPDKRFAWLFCLLALLLVFVSGSATGCMVFAFLGAGALLRRMKPIGRILVPVILLVGIALFLSLPHLLGRSNLFNSAVGRTDELRGAFSGLSGIQVITGKAFGAGTGAAFHLFEPDAPWSPQAGKGAFTATADSLPTMLLLGVGLPGLLTFYFLLLWGAVRDPVGIPFFAVVILTSLTGKVVEIFPVNLFLAAALARAFMQVPAADASTETHRM